MDNNPISYNNGSNFYNYNKKFINSLDIIGGTPQNARNYTNDSYNNNNNNKNQSSYTNRKPQVNSNLGQNYQRDNNNNMRNNYRNNNNHRQNMNSNSRNQPYNNYQPNQYNPKNYSKRLRDQFFDNFGSTKYHHTKPIEEYRNKVTCPLCGDPGHISIKCRKMRLDNGKLKIIPPTSQACSICLRATKNEQKLLHPEDLCFRRPAFIQAQREGKHRDQDMRMLNQEYRSRIKSQ